MILRLLVLALAVGAAPAAAEAAPSLESSESSETAPEPKKTKTKKTKTKKSSDDPPQAVPAKTKKAKTASETPKKKKKSDDDDADGAFAFNVEAGGRIGEGVITGEGVSRTSDGSPAVMTVAGVALKPVLSFSIFELSAPTQLEHRETFGNHLTRTDVSSSLELEVKPMRQFRATVEAGAIARSRPEWLDPYQPIGDLADNGLLTTDRASMLDVHLGARTLIVPWSRTWVRVKYDFDRTTTAQDPNFQAVERPNHLTPTDNDQHVVTASFKTTFGTLKPSIAASVFRREFFFVFARDAGTGATHAGAGGAPPNPLQVFHGVELEPEAELDLLGGALELDLRWRLRLVDDIYAGYYSNIENRFTVAAKGTAGPRDLAVDLRGKFEFSLVDYGDNSYRETATRPPLDFGAQRETRRASASFEAHFPAKAPLRLFIDVDTNSQLTNFPDYAPGVFPKRQAYTIDWDYRNARALIGCEFDLDR